MRRIHGLLAAVSFLAVGCGYVGGPITPLANVPAIVTDLAAVERGSVVIVHFTVPQTTTENNPILKPVKLDLRAGLLPEPFSAEVWAEGAKRMTEIHIDHGIATCEIPAEEWAGKDVVIGVRAIGANGKAAGWSNYAVVPVIAAPEPPANVRLENVAAGVRVTWSAGGASFRVIRRSGSEEPWAVMATVAEHEWTDTSTEYGKPYTYEVQTLVDVGNRKVAESDFSAPQPITPKDVFPPAAPVGLRAIPSPGSIELVWEPNTEADLAGYLVYRATGDGAWQKLADGNAIPSYSDRAVEHGKTYRYAISAVDRSGNESGRSAGVEATYQ